MNASITDGHIPHIQKAADSRTLATMHIETTGSTVPMARIGQTIVSTTESWTGLNWADANSLVVASEESTLNGVKRSYLGSARLTLSTGSKTIWQTFEGCWGTKVTTLTSRIGDTHLYNVSRTTTNLSVSNAGGTLELL